MFEWFFILPKCLICITRDLCFFFLSILFPLFSHWFAVCLRRVKSDHFSRVFIIHLQGGQLMEYTLKLSKSGSAGGERDIPKSEITPL